MHIVGPLDATYTSGRSSDTTLGAYLARPAEIWNSAWTFGSGLSATVSPWHAFLNRVEVKQKIEGFRHLRGHLKIRVVLTGNPFLFGRAIVAYEPFADINSFRIGNTAQQCALMELSQRPHIYLDATTSSGGEMTLPFFSPYTWLDLTHPTAAQELGKLYINSMTTLSHANSSSGDVMIRMYAWMEDAELCTPTTVAPFTGISYQSGTTEPLQFTHERVDPLYQTWEKGVVSKTATQVAKAAGMLSHIPEIAPFALATETAAKAVGAAASIFGLSRPQVLQEPPKDMRGYGELATANTADNVKRLALDAKGQLTIDPRSVGLNGMDEMAIGYVISREAYFASPPWFEADSIGSTLIEIGVSPILCARDTSEDPWASTIPPCAGVALMFERWRGKMIYRFSIVASAMHRGKLLVQYDPVNTSTLPTSTNEVYSRIIDIAETRDFEIEVEWHSATPWLDVWEPTWNTFGDLGFKVASTYGIDPTRHNGKLSISVLNPLTSPDPDLGNNVTIQCFVRMDPMGEFAHPAEFSDRSFRVTSTRVGAVPQSFSSASISFAEDIVIDPLYQTVDPSGGEEVAEPLGGDPIEPIGDVSQPTRDPLNYVFMGEAIGSLRTIMKRYTRQSVSAPGIGASPLAIRARRAITGAVTPPVIEWCTIPYVGWRGSRRMRAVSPYSTWSTAVTWGYTDSPMSSISGESGCALGAGDVPVEIPYYSNKRFAFSRVHPAFTSPSYPITDRRDPNELCMYLSNISTAGAVTTDVFRAVGEDFSLFFFIGWPRLYQK